MSEQLMPLLFLVLVAAAFWLLILRPARQRQRQQAELLATLKPGSRVLMGSGMVGQIVALRDEDVDVRIAPDVVVTFVRQAVLRELPDEVAAPASPSDADASRSTDPDPEGTARDDSSSG